MAERSIIVTGSKGGAGTTTVALNLAVQIAQPTKKRVALLELARPFGQIALMLDVEPRFTLQDALDRGERLDEAVLVSLTTRHKIGVEILMGARHLALHSDQRQLLLISEPSDLAPGMLVRYLDAVDSAGLERDLFQIVINHSRQNDDATIAAHERQLRQTFFAQLPNDYRQVSEAIKLRVPLTTSSNNALIGRYREMASRLVSPSLEGSKLSRDTAAVLSDR